ncbi:hypothetical protein BCR44DRAFT_1252519 [Catenaria anguillulae PL171]|uniref:Transmembrane protein n=1 Tax=Catenaria anguillulae PL171 TaxID=765915 RepID=A0A1Y2HC19_9FUNG|nr:hypothetical protein BCR44DRAFT_1252519 [Catenaria anguillulae PL171]
MTIDAGGRGKQTVHVRHPIFFFFLRWFSFFQRKFRRGSEAGGVTVGGLGLWQGEDRNKTVHVRHPIFFFFFFFFFFVAVVFIFSNGSSEEGVRQAGDCRGARFVAGRGQEQKSCGTHSGCARPGMAPR